MKEIRPVDKVLLALLKSDDYVSGEKLAKELLISRAAIHKRIEKLRSLGYHIGGESHKGFLLSSPYPYKIILEQIQQNLKTSHPQLFFIPKVSSTNMKAKEIVSRYKDSFILLTREQIKGRGRMDRSWQMIPDKDIAMSFVVPCELSQQYLFSIIRLSAVAICRVLNKYSNNRCQIKWPNDIIIDGKKICGILTESILEDNAIKYIVIGIGVNINSEPSLELDTSVSLKELIHQESDINNIYADMITLLTELWQKFPKNEKDVVKEWRTHLAWLGEEVQLNYYDQVIQGIFDNVLDNGTLVLEINGKKQEFMIGDLTGIKFRKGLL